MDLHTIIDQDHPFWIQLHQSIELSFKISITEYNWANYIYLFTRDQLQTFAVAFPNVTQESVSEKLVCTILRNMVTAKAFPVLDMLHELWNYEYDSESADYIKVCLTDYHNTVEETILFVEYFLNHGATLQKHHAARALRWGPSLIKIMLENGIDVDDITSACCKKLYDSNLSMLKNMQFLLEYGVDLVGHIKETTSGL
jgi:hypothetical protein